MDAVWPTHGGEMLQWIEGVANFERVGWMDQVELLPAAHWGSVPFDQVELLLTARWGSVPFDHAGVHDIR